MEIEKNVTKWKGKREKQYRRAEERKEKKEQE